MSRKPSPVTRRTYVEASAALLAGGLLAGCMGGTDGDGSTPDPVTTGAADGTLTTDVDETASAETTSTSTAAAESASTETAASTSGEIPALSDDATEYLSDARNYAGDGPTDYTGQSEVEVANGAGTRGMAFDPAAIAVSPGTTVVWQWTGRGGEHDVVAVDGSFESELVESDSKTFSHTFDASGEWIYNCSEHERRGMKGVVVVV